MSDVPPLRFPEFSGEWKSCYIKDILSIGNGRDYKHLSKGNIPVFGTGGYMTSVNDYLHDGETTFIGRKGTINKPFYYNGKFWTVDTLFYTHSFIDTIPRFIYCLFQTINWLRYNEASGVPSLSKDTIEKIKVCIPNLEEQAKIATLLRLIDERIVTQNKIIEDLKLLKSAIVDKLTTPQKEWKSTKIGNVLSIGSGRDYKHLEDGNIPVYGTGGYMLSVDSYLYDGESVCIGRKGTINKPIFLKGKFWTVDTLFYTHTFRSITPRFCYYLFTTIDWLKYNEASGVPSLSKVTIENISISIPDLVTQKQLCAVLDSMTDKLDIEQKLLDAYHAQKQYLLQQIFI